MNRNDLDNELVKHLDLFSYWDGIKQFRKEKAELRFHYMIQSLWEAFRKTRNVSSSLDLPSIERPIMVGLDTQNQRNALNSLLNLLLGDQHTISFLEGEETQELSEDQITRLSLTHWKQWIRGYIYYRNDDKSVFKQRWPYYFEILGEYEYIRRVLADNSDKIKLYIGSNDHSGISQAGFVASRQLGIENLYIQHAAVSNAFPPLMSTYALLDGEDSKEKYLQGSKTDTEIRLIGSLRFDKYLKEKKYEKKGNVIGVCYSPIFHDFDMTMELCETLEKEGVEFEVRLHPSSLESQIDSFQSRGWRLSLPAEENPIEFILKCHTVISGDSTILLEAIVMKRRPVYFASKGHIIDYYGFLKNGLLSKGNVTVSEVMNDLARSFDIEAHRIKAKKYNHALYSDWEGRSTELAANTIRKIIDA